MAYPVNKDEIARFDELYHKLIKTNLGSGPIWPKELKSLTTTDISVLNIAATNPSIIIREIALCLNIPNSTLTSSINRLEKTGIAGRIISPRDRRSFSLVLTEKGMAVQKMHIDFEKAFFEMILQKLPSGKERTALMDLMETIAGEDSATGNGDESHDENL
jgi:DNA-binding MarR family transcriptional regulator